MEYLTPEEIQYVGAKATFLIYLANKLEILSECGNYEEMKILLDKIIIP